MVYLSWTRKTLQPYLALSLAALMVLAGSEPSQAESSLNQPVPSSTASCSSEPEPYVIGPGDRIKIKFLEADQYSDEYLVLEGGRLLMPLVGGISVEGLTFEDLTNYLATEYLRFFKEKPLLSVSLLVPRPTTVLISGEINHPGYYNVPLTAGAGDPRPGIQSSRLSQAILLAGGTTLTADLRWVQIRRKQRGGTEKIINVNLWDVINNAQPCQDISLRDGDTIFIPTASEINPEEMRQLATTNLATDIRQPRSVVVVGEVLHPGSYVVIGGNTMVNLQVGGFPTVSRAIQIAGGITPEADLRNVQLRRRTHQGLEQTLNINFLQLLQTGMNEQDIIVQDGDTIVIPKATDLTPAEIDLITKATFGQSTIQVNVAGEVVRSGAVELPANATLNQALLAAGGFIEQRAKIDSVELIRLNPNGSVEKRTIDIDLAAFVNTEANPRLQNNDMIIVKRSGISVFNDTLDTVLNSARILLPWVQIYRMLAP